MRFAFHYCSI